MDETALSHHETSLDASSAAPPTVGTDAERGERPEIWQERARRHRVLKSARVTYAGNAISVDVVVRDLSITGARIEALQDLPLPDTFHLRFNDGRRADCAVVWPAGDQVGVRFFKPIEMQHKSWQVVYQSDPPQSRLRRKRPLA